MRRLPILLEDSTQVRIYYDDDKKLHWVIRVNDLQGETQEFYSESEPCMLVYMRNGISEKTVMRTYPTDEITRYKKSFE